MARIEKPGTWLALAFHLCGGPYGIAEVCGITKRGTLFWKLHGRFPCNARGRVYAAKIEAKTGGRIKATLLFNECVEKSRAANKKSPQSRIKSPET
jgi:hypothetical protein